MTDLLTISYIATQLERGERSTRSLIEDGKLHAVKIGQHVRVTRAEFDRFLRELPPVQLTPRKRKGAAAEPTPATGAGARS